MKLPFKGSYRQSQGFGENPASYAKFGYKGHNGLDHAVPSGTDLFAMITGTVIESRLDATGYGNYVKIENDKEGALVAHMSSLAVKPGDQVIEGQTYLGKSGNTGNSTGAHTHTGYYTKPRDRQNGYGGYIDFTKLLTGESSMTMYKGYDLDNKESMKIAVDKLVLVMSGDLVEKSKLEEALKFLAECKANPPSSVEWVENGKSVETTNGNTKTTINFAKKN